MPAALIALALGQLAPLPATLPTRFYNRPGASPDLRDADLVRCRTITIGPMADVGAAVVKDRRLTPPVGTMPEAPPAVTAPGDAIDACMNDRGWRLYALSLRVLGAAARHRADPPRR